jgi:PhnB protein
LQTAEGTERQSAEMEIRRILDAQADALWRKDVAGLLADYTPDVVSFDLAPPLQHVGPSPMEAALWLETWDGPILQSISQFQATVADAEGIAYCHGLVHLVGTKVGVDGLEGDQVDLWFRSTWCLRRVDGAWKIAHEHASTPFYMDGSEQAALDLTPESGACS